MISKHAKLGKPESNEFPIQFCQLPTSEIGYNTDMRSDSYRNISARISDEQLGLGWISGITLWKSPVAVAMEPHRHPHIEPIFCLKGELTYEVDGFGSIVVSEGTGVIMPAHTTHVLRGGTDMPCVRIGLHIRSSMPAKSHRYGVFSSGDFGVFLAKLKDMSARTFRLNNQALDAIKELSARVATVRPNSAERGILRTLCSLILYRVIDILSHPLVATGPVIMDEATRYIEEHFAEKLSVDGLVRRMGYGRTQLFSLFKQHTGLTPNEYLVRYRVLKASEMIKRGKPVTEVSKAVGFSTPSYFRSVYLKYTGKKPSDEPSSR